MTRLTLNRALKTAPLIALGLLLPTAAQAQEAAPTPEYAMIFNTLLFLIGGFLVMWMAAGFAMLEMGLVRSKNVSMQGLKNIALYSIAGIMFWLTGYNLMYTGVDGGFIGSFGHMTCLASALTTIALAIRSLQTGFSKWSFVPPQRQSFPVHWLSGLNFGRSSSSLQF